MFNQSRAGSPAFFLFTVLILVFVTSSLAQAGPVLDGNIDDVLLLANQNIASGSAAGIIIQDPARDVCMGDTLILPCSGVLHTSLSGCRTYDNGYDIGLVCLAIRNDETWIGMRVNNGDIGDTDGDGTDSAGVDCPDRGTGRIADDPAGIGDGEYYLFRLDTNCDGVTDYRVSVHGGAGGAAPVVSITRGDGLTPVSVTSAEARFAGSDLEIFIQGLPLPRVFSLNAWAYSAYSGMSGDACGPAKANVPLVAIVLESDAPPDSFVRGQAQWVSFHLANQSPVPVEALGRGPPARRLAVHRELERRSASGIGFAWQACLHFPRRAGGVHRGGPLRGRGLAGRSHRGESRGRLCGLRDQLLDGAIDRSDGYSSSAVESDRGYLDHLGKPGGTLDRVGVGISQPVPGFDSDLVQARWVGSVSRPSPPVRRRWPPRPHLDRWIAFARPLRDDLGRPSGRWLVRAWRRLLCARLAR